MLCAVSPFAPRADGAEDHNLEPVPPDVFFRLPDETTETEIRALVANAFGDFNKTPPAREQLVRRFHVWSVAHLLIELAGEEGLNESKVWNSLLTLAALRDTWGPAPELRSSIAPINRVITANEPWRRAFACLAAGCNHWAQGDTPGPVVPDGLVSDDTARMNRDLEDSVRRLSSALSDPAVQVRASALLALAKRGGTAARNATLSHLATSQSAANQDRWAAMIARGFLKPPDGRPYFKALGEDDNPLRRSAALGLAVAMLHEGREDGPAAWTTEKDPILVALRGVPENSVAGPESVFARGVCAWVNQAPEEWEALWGIAIGKPRSEEEAAIAAIQALLFCEQRWFVHDATAWAARPTANVPDAVQAGFVLLAAQSGSGAGVEAARGWLSNGARRPRGDADWDVRFYAAVGLLRALSSGAVDPKLREDVVTSLESALKTVHPKSAFRVALAAFLDAEKENILSDDFYRVPQAAVDAVEQSFSCPYALLSRDLRDVAVHRLNKFVQKIYHLDNIVVGTQGKPNTKDTPKRFLRSYFDAYPYFSRLEFLDDRGTRPLPRLEPGERGLDR